MPECRVVLEWVDADGTARREERQVPPEGLTLGTATLFPDEVARGVSRAHAQIVPRSGGVVVVDLASLNGTWRTHLRRDGATDRRPAVPSASLVSKDRLQLGNLEVVVRVNLEGTRTGGTVRVGRPLLITVAPRESPAWIQISRRGQPTAEAPTALLNEHELRMMRKYLARMDDETGEFCAVPLADWQGDLDSYYTNNRGNQRQHALKEKLWRLIEPLLGGIPELRDLSEHDLFRKSRRTSSYSSLSIGRRADVEWRGEDDHRR